MHDITVERYLENRLLIARDSRWAVNSTAFAARGEFMVIDTLGSPALFSQAMAAFKDELRVRLHATVNTHHHYDHVLGNQYCGEAAIHAHRHVPAWMDSYEERLLQQVAGRSAFDDLTLTRPTETISTSTCLEMGGLKIELVVPGPCHTDNDVMVFIPEEGVLVTGDIFVPGTVVPLNPNSGGDLANWIKTLRWIEELQPELIIPGHFQPEGVSSVAQQRQFMEALLETAQEMGADDDSWLPNGIAALEAYKNLNNFSRYSKKNLRAAWAMLRSPRNKDQ